jgi:hypothetical protein
MPNNSTDFDTEHKTLADPEESEIMPTGKDMSLCKKKGCGKKRDNLALQQLCTSCWQEFNQKKKLSLSA